jgi:polysaccharide pyruvyl transferase WcaK-like protein/SAM-dependent methyltransferase
MKFLITNSVPLNGGDEALLRAVVTTLERHWPEAEVTVLCKDLERCREQLPDLDLDSDLEFAKTKKERERILGHYQKSDIVLSAPGGFLHDYYSVEERLRGFEAALELSKPVVLLAQSIGPFWKSKSIERVRDVLSRVSLICLRDEISKEQLAKCGVDLSRTRMTGDAAFLWHRTVGELFHSSEEDKARLIGLSFRVWPLGDKVKLRDTIAKAVKLCEHLLADGETKILFLSTCQGVAGYVDDSEIARQIRERLPHDLQERCDIDAARYAPRDLIQALGRCDAFIGMRLHACILAMLAGVPAMGLGYEDKTEQIFKQMGLEAYQLRFEADEARWIESANAFLANLKHIRAVLPAALEGRCKAAEQNIAAVEELVSSTLHENGTVTPEQRWSKSVVRYGQPHLRLRQVATLVNGLKPKRMLDVGCATGHLRELCPGIAYVGCDFIAPESPIEFPFYQCNFNRDPIPGELRDFDVVVCSGILEYIDDVPAFLKNLRSRLTADGHLVLTYFNMNHIRRLAAMAGGRSFAAHPDWRGFYSPADFRELVANSGMRVVKTIPMNHSLGKASSVEETVSAPLSLPGARWWSALLAHQFLFVAASDSRNGRRAG